MGNIFPLPDCFKENHDYMNVPGKINIEDFSYDLPDDRIAKFPLKNRDDSKLLYYKNGLIESKKFYDLPSIIDNDYDLIFNETKVIQARLIFHKPTGSGIEILLLEPFLPSDYLQSFRANKECSWKCLVGNAKKWKNEILIKRIELNGVTVNLNVKKSQKILDTFIIHFSWDHQALSFSEIIAHAGLTPIPPYLKREAQKEDIQRYQTVYSAYEGSVAAPTAGLHFTSNILEKLFSNGINIIKLTLHVGAGTFIPVKEKDAMKHIMHTEQIYFSRDSIEKLYNSDRKFIAVGTTSVRSLESLYRIGVKMSYAKPGDELEFIDQWEVYNNRGDISRKESMRKILEYMDNHKLQNFHATTKIMIVPGYDFRMVDGMITNFHQPGSTLLLLIAAFTGDDWRKIYNYAMNNDFRFLSYGDSSLLIKPVISIPMKP